MSQPPYYRYKSLFVKCLYSICLVLILFVSTACPRGGAGGPRGGAGFAPRPGGGFPAAMAPGVGGTSLPRSGVNDPNNPGRLGSVLEAINRSRSFGSARPVLRIDNLGRIYSASEYIGTLESSGVIVRGSLAKEVIGRVGNRFIYEADALGFAGRPIAELRAWTIRPANLRMSPNENSSLVARISKGARVEVIRIDQGWYEIKLVDETQGWIYAPLVGAAVRIEGPNGASVDLGGAPHP